MQRTVTGVDDANRSYPGQELTAAQRDDLNTGVRLASIFGGKQR